MKPTVCVSFEVRHGSAGSRRSQNRNRILGRAAPHASTNQTRSATRGKRNVSERGERWRARALLGCHRGAMVSSEHLSWINAFL